MARVVFGRRTRFSDMYNADARMERIILGWVALTVVSGCEGTEAPLLVFDESSLGGADGSSSSSGGATDEASPDRERLGQVESFQVQLSGSLDLDVEADLFVIDLHSPSDEDFSTLSARSASIGCYFSAGSFEPWRPDADDFPAESLGDPLADYPNENWLDIKSESVVALMAARIESAVARGCTDVFPSLVRPSTSENTFSLSADDFANYAAHLAQVAHSVGLGALIAGGASFDPITEHYDAVLVFGCASAGSCDEWTTFAETERSVFSIEWGDESAPEDACGEGIAWPQIVKNQSLDAFRFVCPG